MKTFEEACQETFAHRPSEKEQGEERSQSTLEKHREFITEIRDHDITHQMIDSYMESINTKIASAILSAFVQGVVIGMLMEKQEGPIE